MVTLEDINRAQEMLNKANIPDDDRFILVPGQINRKTYKGHGRPRNEDYEVRDDIKKLLK